MLSSEKDLKNTISFDFLFGMRLTNWNLLISNLHVQTQGLSRATPLRQSRTAIEIVPLKNGQGDNLSPSKFREKTRKEAHTKRFISVQKLQAETERGKYILSHL